MVEEESHESYHKWKMVGRLREYDWILCVNWPEKDQTILTRNGATLIVKKQFTEYYIGPYFVGTIRTDDEAYKIMKFIPREEEGVAE